MAEWQSCTRMQCQFTTSTMRHTSYLYEFMSVFFTETKYTECNTNFNVHLAALISFNGFSFCFFFRSLECPDRYYVYKLRMKFMYWGSEWVYFNIFKILNKNGYVSYVCSALRARSRVSHHSTASDSRSFCDDAFFSQFENWKRDIFAAEIQL